MHLIACFHFYLFCFLEIQLTCPLICTVLLGLIDVLLSLSLVFITPSFQSIHHLFFNPIVRLILSINVVLEIVYCVLVYVVNLVKET
jgi:hypothetical protein